MRIGLGFKTPVLGKCDREREGTAALPRDPFIRPKRGQSEGGNPERAGEAAGDHGIEVSTLTSPVRKRADLAVPPRLSQFQEAPRAGFQGDAPEAGGRRPRNWRCGWSRAEQVTARPGPSQSLLLKSPGLPVPPVTQPWPLPGSGRAASLLLELVT